MYNDYDNGLAGVSVLFGVAYFFFIMIFALGGYALTAWFLSGIFRKAGIERWKAWVPFYNWWVFLELGGQPGWLAILAVVPIGNIVAVVFMCIAAYHVGLAFAKDGAWVVLYIFLPLVWLGILGLDSSRWEPWRSPVPPVYGANVRPPMPPAAA
jgi:hypothetical protein